MTSIADSVFVQDPVLVVDGRAIVLLSAAESRRGEASSLVAALGHRLPIVALQPPATLDGGDVLITDTHAVCRHLHPVQRRRVPPARRT